MRFIRQNEPAKYDAVLEFSRQRGIQLTADYVDYLISINGGYTGGVDSYAVLGNGEKIVAQQILGLTTYPDALIATDCFTNFSDFVHNRMLCVAYTPNGDSIMLDLRAPTHGKIYIHAHDSPPNDPIQIDATGFEGEGDFEVASLFYPLSDSWTEFVEMLGPSPPFEN